MVLQPSSHTPKLNQIEAGQSQPKNQSPVSGPICNHMACGQARASGGIADELVHYVCELDVEQVDSIWLRINAFNNRHGLIICLVYIPANSPYARIAIFDFRARYINADFCIMGDLNVLVNSKYDR